MEFLRFGSSIPGSYWGCCAMCIIQDFKQDPDEKASIQLVDGDGGHPITGPGSQLLFAGPTWKDIFLQRLRIGTFSSRSMPNHGFLAILTALQVANNPGKKWLKILKDEGFEFIRTVDNSVYSGADTIQPGKATGSTNENYVFGLFRNIGSGAVKNPYQPPKAWTDLPSQIPEVYDFIGEKNGLEITAAAQKHHLERYNLIGEPKFLTEKDLEAAGVPVTYAGKRSEFPQQLKSDRVAAEDAKKKRESGGVSASSPAPFALSAG